MNGIIAKLRTWWETADRTQRTVTVAGAIFFVLLLVGTFALASRPKMSLVFANLAPGDAGAVQMEIEAMGIPVTMDNGGNISVPSDKVALVRARLAQNNKLPKSPHPGYEGLTSMGMMNTPKVEAERLKTMLEGELAKSIEMFEGVESARVHLTFGIDSPFASDKKDATASVTLAERSGTSLTPEQGRAMASLIASAVPGLDSKKVAVFTREGRSVFDGSSTDAASGQALTKLELERKMAQQKRDELQQILNRVAGPGNALVMVDLGLNVDQVDIQKDERKPVKTPIAETSVEETMGEGAQAGAGLAGAATNLPNATQPTTPATPDVRDGDYAMVQKNIQRLEDRTLSTVRKGVGEVQRMAVTVFLNKPKVAEGADAAKAETEALEREEAVRRAVNTYLGLAKANPNAATPPLNQPLAFAPKEGYTSEIISYAFDQSAQKEQAAAAAEAASAQRMQMIMSMLPIAALVLIGFLVMRQIGKFAKGSSPAGAPALAGATPVGSLPMGGAPMLAQAQGVQPAITAGSTPVPQRPMDPAEELRQRALEAGISEEELSAAIAAAGDKGFTIEDIPSIANKINLPLEQIRKMGDDRPETVAMLLKGWLLEDRR